MSFSESLQKDFLAVREPDSVSVPSHLSTHLNEGYLLLGTNSELLLQALRNITEPQARTVRNANSARNLAHIR